MRENALWRLSHEDFGAPLPKAFTGLVASPASSTAGNPVLLPNLTALFKAWEIKRISKKAENEL